MNGKYQTIAEVNYLYVIQTVYIFSFCQNSQDNLINPEKIDHYGNNKALVHKMTNTKKAI